MTATLATRRPPGRSRARRNAGADPAGLAPAGRPISSALTRVPFVIALIAVLSAGIAAVLYVTTKADESGMRTEVARATSAELRLQIEALNRSIAELSATPRIAEEARDLGLVPVDDATVIVIDPDGNAVVWGPEESGDDADEADR